jgi:anthranilate phosphoribosyltransferase
VHELVDGEMRTFALDPLDLGLARATPEQLRGSDAAANARVVESVLAGEKGAPRDIAVLNAAAALVVGGAAPDLAGGVDAAASSIDSGRARTALAALVRTSNAPGSA